MKASYIAVIAVAIIAIAAVGAYVLLSNGNNGGGSSEEPIRTDLKVGDYIERSFSGNSESTETQTNYDTEQFLTSNLYRSYAGEVTGQETLKFKGKDYVCDVYKENYEEVSSTMWVIKDSDVVLKSVTTINQVENSTVLDDTNLDITKAIEDQVLADGSFAKLIFNMGSAGLITETTKTISELSEGTCTLTTDTLYKIDYSLKETIKAIDGNQVTLDDDSTETVNQFLSGVSFKSYIKSLEEDKTAFVYGDKKSETIDTKFGKKNVTVQDITVTDEDGEETYTIYYSSNDVIYKMTQDPNTISDILSTSLVKL